MKGQSAVELTLVLGMAIILSSPFIISSQSTVLDLSQASQLLRLETSLDELESNSNLLSDKSFPARRLIRVSIPEDVKYVYNPIFENSSAVVFSVNSGGHRTNHSIVLDYPLRVDNKTNLSREGVHKVSLKKVDNGVNASVVP